MRFKIAANWYCCEPSNLTDSAALYPAAQMMNTQFRDMNMSSPSNSLPCPLVLKLCECSFRNAAIQWAEQTQNIPQSVSSFQELQAIPFHTSPGVVLVDVQQADCTVRQLLGHFHGTSSSAVPIICFDTDELPLLCELSLEFNFIPAAKNSERNAVWQVLAVASSRSRKLSEVAFQATEIKQKLSQFTSEQRKLLTHWIEGWPNKQLAAELDVCLRTVQLRKQMILTQFEATSVNEILLRFVRCGIDYQS